MRRCSGLLERQPRVAYLLRSTLLFAFLAAGILKSDAGEAHGTLNVSVTLLPLGGGNACSLASSTREVRVVCAPQAVPLITPPASPLAQVPAARAARIELNQPIEAASGDIPAQAGARGNRELREKDVDSTEAELNIGPSTEPRSTRFREYTSRAMVVGGFRYVEMTVSW